MAVNKDDLTMSELMRYIEHLEHVVRYYNPSEIINMTTEDFKAVCAKVGNQ